MKLIEKGRSWLIDKRMFYHDMGTMCPIHGIASLYARVRLHTSYASYSQQWWKSCARGSFFPLFSKKFIGKAMADKVKDPLLCVNDVGLRLEDPTAFKEEIVLFYKKLLGTKLGE